LTARAVERPWQGRYAALDLATHRWHADDEPGQNWEDEHDREGRRSHALIDLEEPI